MRTLTSAITASIDSAFMQPIYVVEISDGSTTLCRATNWGTIDDWAGAGNDATPTLIKCPEIRQEIDWRGGLAYFTQPAFEIADEDGAIRAALRDSQDYDIDVYWLLKSGTIDKATQAIQVYAGVVASYRVKGPRVTIIGGDRRSKRYPREVLGTVTLENETNYVAAGRKQSAIGTWDMTTWHHEEDWLPADQKGRLIPITFNRPERCKLQWVSAWPGGQDISDSSYDLRGPMFILSDLRLDYGSGGINPVGTLFRVDRETGEIFNATAGYNDIQKGQLLETTGPTPLVCLAAEDYDECAATHGFNVNTYHRLWPHNRESLHANLSGDWQSFWDKLEDQYQAIKWSGVSIPGNSDVTIMDLYFWDSRIPSDAVRVRHAYIEAFVKNYGTTLPSGVEIQIALRRNTDWSGHTQSFLDWITLLDSSTDEFNNWDWGSGSENWAHGSVSFGGSNPFHKSGSLGREKIDTFRDVSIQLRAENTNVGAADISGGDFRVFGYGLIVCVDWNLEAIHDRLGVDCEYSFDNYYRSRTGSSDYCRAWETILSTLVKIFGVSTSDILASTSWSTLAGSGIHDDHRLDFQLIEQKQARELLDEMALQSSLWLCTGDDGKETPIFFSRLRNRGSDETNMDPDFDEDTIKAGSLQVDLGPADDLFNEFRIRYYKDHFDGEFMEEIYVDASGGNCPNSLINTTVSGWCSDSQSRHGVTNELAFDAYMIQDDTTAENLLKAMAAKFVERPWVARFRTSLAGMRWQLGDFPLLGHADWLAVAQKYQNTAPLQLSFEASGSDYKFVISSYTYDAQDMQPGDWIKADVNSGDTFDGWYRVTNITVTSTVNLIVAAPSGASGTYGVNSIEVYPAMMVTGHQVKGNEVEMELTEIPYDPE